MIGAPLLFAGLLFISLPHMVQAQRAPRLAPGPSPVLWQRVPVAAASVEPLGGFLGPGDEDRRYEGFFVGAGLGIAGVFSLGGALMQGIR